MTIAIMLSALSATETTAMPLTGSLVDLRREGHHGKVYSLWNLAFTLAFIFGPVIGGSLTYAGTVQTRKDRPKSGKIQSVTIANLLLL